MATQFQARSAIIKQFLEAWEDSAKPSGYRTPYTLDGAGDVKFNPPPNDSWVRVSVQFHAPSKTQLGRVGSGVRIDRPGVLYIQAFVPHSGGVKEIDELTSIASTALEGRKIPNIGEFLLSEVDFVGDEGAYYQANLEIPFIWRDRR